MSDIPAAPSVRRLARELDVDIRKVKGTGPGNRVTATDVKESTGEGTSKKQEDTVELPDFPER